VNVETGERTGAFSAAGLTAVEAAQRLRRYGANSVAARRRVPPILVWAGRIATDPMAILLAVAAATYVALGDQVDAWVAGIALVPIVLVGVVLEGRADAALARLRDLAAPRARVVRDGVEQEIRAEDVVPGDLLVVGEGDVVAADGDLVEGRLAIDESALTGESIPVEHAPGGDVAIAAGTVVVGGRGTAHVRATGEASRYGAIAAMLRDLTPPRTPIESAIRGVVFRIGIAVVCICVAVAVSERMHGSPWTVALIAAVSLGMAAMPEELPMVYTLYLALGAWRLARDRALVRRLGSVETLGSTSTICVDKTGTLTHGRVELAEVVAREGDEETVLETAVLASEPRGADPLDAAFTRAVLVDPRVGAALLEDVPYDARRRYAAKRWRLHGEVIHAVKGALEAVLDLTHADPATRAEAWNANDRLAAEGMRVLAVARAADRAPLRLLGLAGFRDPVRDDAPAALAECRSAGVRVVMITGDHPTTARAIAQRVGFGADADRLVTGDALDAADDDARRALIGSARVFARTRPEQKLTIVRALRANGEVVAMTGDGTNDALALREADIGIAMGRRGTEVAREAAGLVLLDDDVSTIVRAIRDGRRIFDNLRKAFGYLVGFHAPLLAGAIALPALGLPLLLEPIHLVWLELVVHPTSSLVYEGDPADADVMRRPPRPRTEGLLRRSDWLRPALLGTTLALAVVALDAWLLLTGTAVGTARAAALIVMFVGQTVLVFVQRSPARPVWRGAPPTPVAWWLAGATLASLALAILVPPLASVLHLGVPSPSLALSAVGAALAATLWLEPFKR